MTVYQEFAAHMANVEKALPSEPLPLQVAADWCDENERANWAYMLRWCAGWKVRPFFRAHIKRRPWEWTRKQDRYPGTSRAEVKSRDSSMLPLFLFSAMSTTGWVVCFPTATWAYQTLINALIHVRDRVAIPDLPPVIVKPAEVRVICCRECGITRAPHVEVCPVCKSREVIG